MATVNSNGHGVTSVLNGSATNVVIKADVKFPPAPTQNGGVPS